MQKANSHLPCLLFQEGFQSKSEIDFSKKWIDGIKEGWYWAFITQGTHGYVTVCVEVYNL